MTRRGCLLGALLWLLIMLLPLAALVFAIRGEVAWQRGRFVEDRLWLVQSQDRGGQAAAGGLAYSAARIISDERAAGGPVCVRTRVYFWLWRAADEVVTYCECYQPRAGAPSGYEILGACP